MQKKISIHSTLSFLFALNLLVAPLAVHCNGQDKKGTAKPADQTQDLSNFEGQLDMESIENFKPDDWMVEFETEMKELKEKKATLEIEKIEDRINELKGRTGGQRRPELMLVLAKKLTEAHAKNEITLIESTVLLQALKQARAKAESVREKDFDRRMEFHLLAVKQKQSAVKSLSRAVASGAASNRDLEKAKFELEEKQLMLKKAHEEIGERVRHIDERIADVVIQRTVAEQLQGSYQEKLATIDEQLNAGEELNRLIMEIEHIKRGVMTQKQQSKIEKSEKIKALFAEARMLKREIGLLMKKRDKLMLEGLDHEHRDVRAIEQRTNKLSIELNQRLKVISKFKKSLSID